MATNQRFTSRRLPDNISIEMAAILIKSKKTPMGFNPIFDKVFENLKHKNMVSGGEEMLRLRTYEKLQNMVNRGLVEKVGKEYQAKPELAKEYQPNLSAQTTPEPEPKPKPQPVKKAVATKPLGDKLVELAMDAARNKGAKYPSVGESSDGRPVLVDTDSGDCYEVVVTVKKIK